MMETYHTLGPSPVDMDSERVISILRRTGHEAMTSFRKTDPLSSVCTGIPDSAYVLAYVEAERIRECVGQTDVH